MRYCFSCKSVVNEFPHQCPMIFGQAKTHDFKLCSDIHGWHANGSFVKCEKCLWHIPAKELADVAECPINKGIGSDLSKSLYTGLTNGKMLCPTCGGAMRKLFTSKDGKESKYYCPKCAPLSGISPN